MLIGALLAMSVSLVSTTDANADKEVKWAMAVLHPSENSSVSGIAFFTKVVDGVLLSATITGLNTGKNGFHVHELGDCSAADADLRRWIFQSGW
jgi:Cu-Zn family superoxide dismutase